MGLKSDGRRLALENYPLRLTIPTRYGDMDTNAHLNNVAIARLMEESRVRFHYSLRADGGDLSPGGAMVAHVAIDYLGEGEYPADVEAGVGVVEIGRTSYRLAIGLFQNGRAFALADSVIVRVSADRGSAPLPQSLRDLLDRQRVISAAAASGGEGSALHPAGA